MFYAILVVEAIVIQIVLRVRLKGKKETKTTLYLRIMLLGISIISLAYFFEFYAKMIDKEFYNETAMTGTILLGYTFVGYTSYLLVLNIVSLRTKVRFTMRMISYIALTVLILGTGSHLLGGFIYIYPEFLSHVYLITAAGSIFLILFSLIFLHTEHRQTMNKMDKLRLKAIIFPFYSVFIVASIRVLITGFDFTSTLYLLVDAYISNVIILILFSLTIISLYYSIFPPLWLQRITGVLPPSFLDLKRKQERLKQRGVQQ